MKTRIQLLFLLLTAALTAQAQVLKPIRWEHRSEPTEIAPGGEVDLVFRAVIDRNWYLYSNDFDPDLGPMLTEFEFEPHDSYELVGAAVAVDPSKKFDEIWKGDVTYFKGTGEFRQRVRVLSAAPQIRATASYQVCNDADGKCIPFEDDFVFDGIAVTGDAAAAGQLFAPAVIPGMQGDAGAGGLLEPARWTVEISGDAGQAGGEAELIFRAEIDPDWYMYSSDFTLDPGPIPAQISFVADSSYSLIGEWQPVGAARKYEEVFEGEVTYFKGQAEFRQKVRIERIPYRITGTIEYQVCSEVDGKCIPFEYDFAAGEAAAADRTVSAEVEQHRSLLMSRDTYSPFSLLAFMLIAFLAGLAALFTPCVFPMIPMTVSFFTGRAKNRRQGVRNALLYGFSIILIYTLIGSVLAPFMGPETANELATNWIPNVLFFLIFLVFAISFFGLFEINLPSSWVNRIDRKADQGGLIGIFFMAFTLVLVSFSCTGPLVGSILVESAGGQFLKPILGMFAFSLAFAIPFTLFAIFPEWLNSLPKSGGWLNSVKVVLGFLELALALKFLSIADQAYHWGILDREVYLAFWITIFTLMGLYLLGKIRLPHDSPMEVVGVGRLLLAIITFSFVVYLVPGMFGAPLKAMAGYLPPMSTHDFNLSLPGGSTGHAGGGGQQELCDAPKYADFLHFPHGLKGYFDYEQALNCARERGMPVFVDFTGHGCVNCREMEARVWSDPEVLRRLRDDFVLLALYVDDKTGLDESEWYVSEYDGKVKKTIGRQNADLQIRRFNNNAQPFYLILGPGGELLVPPRAYDLSIPDFIAFLDGGLAAFRKKAN
jgi:thiol:disulfide interchange protein